jgi:glycolate oxidase iron-sulfur subunit
MRLTELIHALEELQTTCNACNRCGMCQAVCPLFKETGREGDIARGKLSLIDGLRQELLTRPDRVLDRLNRCLLCGACERNCPRKLNLVDVFIKARLIITGYSGLAAHKKLIFRVLLGHPQVFDKATRILSMLQQAMDSSGSGTDSWKNIVKRIPFLKERHIIPLARRSFHTRMKNETTLSVNSLYPERSVLFFAGCLIDKMMPEVGVACISVLKQIGVDVQLMENESCCGIPALTSGDSLGFDQLLVRNLDAISRHSFDVMVTACATCTMTIHDFWPKMHHGGYEISKRALDAAGRVMDINGYVLTRTDIVRIIGEKSGHKPLNNLRTLTFHEPCHLKKGDVSGRIRELLKHLPGYRYVETREPGACCGMGGSFNLTHYNLSRAIGEKKARNIVESGADIVCTACPACMMQLKDMLHQIGSTVEVKHVMEILAEILDSE